MNIRFLASNLEEAQEELKRLSERAKAGNEIPFEDFHLAMAHIYHHLNSAWNGRDISDSEWHDCTDESFNRLQQFPHDLPLIGDENYYDLPEYNGRS